MDNTTFTTNFLTNSQELPPLPVKRQDTPKKKPAKKGAATAFTVITEKLLQAEDFAAELTNTCLAMYDAIHSGATDEQELMGAVCDAAEKRGLDRVKTARDFREGIAQVKALRSKQDTPVKSVRVDEARQAKEPAKDRQIGYYTAGGGLFRGYHYQNSYQISQLTNFNAEILTDITEDSGDGQTEHVFEVQVTLSDGVRCTGRVRAKDFGKMDWVIELLGARAIIYPNQTSHARAAIQTLSRPATKRVYTATGFQKIEGQDVYLHRGGALTPTGTLDVEVRLPEPLQPCLLADPPSTEEWKRNCLDYLHLQAYAPDAMTVPMMTAPILPLIGRPNFSLHVAGTTGFGKSSFSMLIQTCYGTGFFDKFPADWSSSENYLEMLPYIAKNMMLVIDEFKPPATERQKWLKRADRVFRAQANYAGRGTLHADRSINPGKPPRGAILSNGEELPEGHSLGARLARIEGENSKATPAQWIEYQSKAQAGIYTRFLSGFIAWLLPRVDEIHANAQAEINELALQINAKGQHRRTPQITAQMGRAWRFILQACVAAGAIGEGDFDEMWQARWKVLTSLGEEQAELDAQQDPLNIFAETLASLLLSGKAYLANKEGRMPENNKERYGWRDGLALGRNIGWVGDDNRLWLDPASAYNAIDEACKPRGGFAWNEATLWKRLNQKGWLEVETARATPKIRKGVEGVKHPVISIAEKQIFEGPEKTEKITDTTDTTDTSPPPHNSE